MPIYKYFGHPAKYHGKPLLHILSNLKNFGVGRIIARSSFEKEPSHGDQPSFYRILWVQPMMEAQSVAGSVVAERVRRGVRYTEPVQLRDVAPVPDFKLVPRDLEQEYCKWDKVRDFNPEIDFVTEPKYYTMPPLLIVKTSLMERNHEESFLDIKLSSQKHKEIEIRIKKEFFQETESRFEGLASCNYSGQILDRFRVEEAGPVLAQLPEEPPMPSPAVGMRLYHWPDTSRRHKEDIRTEEHNTYFP